MDRIVPNWRRYLLVQPPMMLLLLVQAMSGTVLTDLIVYRTCTVTLGFNRTECLILHKNGNDSEAIRLNSLVQPHATLIIMSKSVIESLFPTFLSLFLGPWSDKYGRKPVILTGYIGVSLTYLLLSIMASWDITPWYVLIAYIPTTLLGGLSVLLLASMCYITDITDNNERAWHLAWFEALIALGLLIGLFSGPELFQAYGYTVVFSVAAALCAVATLYVLLCVPETVQIQTSGTIREVFDFELLKDLIRTCIKRRDGFNRSLIWSCIGCLTLLLVTLQGELTIAYLFTNARLHWTVEQYSNYQGVNVLLGILGTIFGIKLLRGYAGLPEAIVAIISVISSVGSSLTYAFTWKSWHMYLSVSVGIFSDMCRPMIRAILSKSVPAKDTGKIFSVTTALETLLPYAAASLYTVFYSGYMPPLYPVPVWFLSVACYVVTIILLMNIHIQVKRNVSYSSLIRESDDPNH